MRIARFVLALTLIAGLMLVVLGPLGPWASAQSGKVIKFGVNRSATNLDPVTQDENPNIWAFTQIYQQLVRVNVKGDGFEPDLAEKWTMSPDGRTWTFFSVGFRAWPRRLARYTERWWPPVQPMAMVT